MEHIKCILQSTLVSNAVIDDRVQSTRGTYLADQYRNVPEKCTKLVVHPTLLQGLFTLFVIAHHVLDDDIVRQDHNVGSIRELEESLYSLNSCYADLFKDEEHRLKAEAKLSKPRFYV